MLVIFTLFLALVWALPPFIFLPVSLLSFSLLYFSDLSFSAMQSTSYIYFMDDTSFFMVFMTLFVIFSSYFFSPSTTLSNFVLLVMTIACLGVFISNSLLYVYFFYEASLFPILYIILKWGSYPERSLSSIMLLVYTAVFTLPFIFVIFYAFNFFHSLSLPYLSFNSQPIDSILLVIITFCCFSVNLPVYGLHFWLPIAHVEAPTFGSIILAGVLLKLGGVGLLRSLPLFSLLDCFCYLLSYFMLALVTVTLVCCFQSDMKRLIAYSSVSHMMVLPPLLVMSTSSSLSGVIIIILIHGVASPLLFMLVGIIYSLFSTRQLIFVRGLLVTSPLVSFVCVLSFLFTLSAPPFPSFVAEMAFIFTAILTSYYFIPFVLVFCFLSLLYNLNWLSSVVFSPSPTTSSYSLSFSSFLPIIMSLFMSAYLLPILSFL